MEERQIYSIDKVNVTSTRAIIADQIYEISTIGRVWMAKKKIKIHRAILLGLFILSGLASLPQNIPAGLLVIVIFGGLLYWTIRPTYYVYIAGTSGQSRIFASSKQEKVEPVVTAIQEAMASNRSS